jgi:hypothetical protein
MTEDSAKVLKIRQQWKEFWGSSATATPVSDEDLQFYAKHLWETLGMLEAYGPCESSWFWLMSEYYSISTCLRSRQLS